MGWRMIWSENRCHPRVKPEDMLFGIMRAGGLIMRTFVTLAVLFAATPALAIPPIRASGPMFNIGMADVTTFNLEA